MSEKIICFCMGVSEDIIANAVRNGASTLEDIQRETKACTGNNCRTFNPKRQCCSVDISDIIKKVNGR